MISIRHHERWLGAQALAKGPKHCRAAAAQGAAEEHGIGLGAGHLGGQLVVVPGHRVPSQLFDHLDSLGPRLPGEPVGEHPAVEEIAVIHGHHPLGSDLLRQLGQGHGLVIVGREDASEVALTVRIEPLEPPGGEPGAGRVNPM